MDSDWWDDEAPARSGHRDRAEHGDAAGIYWYHDEPDADADDDERSGHEPSGHQPSGHAPGGEGSDRPRRRVPLKLVVGIMALGAIGAVVALRTGSDGGSNVAAVDPDTGYPWCLSGASGASGASDGGGNRLGDGLGWENGGLCRIRNPSELDSQALAEDGQALQTAPIAPPTTGVEAPGVEKAPTEPEQGQPGDGEPREASGASGSATTADYQSNLAMIRAQTVRNTAEDDSPDLGTPSAQLVPDEHYGPRSDYLGNPGGNPEQAFPVQQGGQFRTGCEFSHFAYDDPLVFPGQPGASHLHMFFGNTDINAYSTADSVLNTGGGTCNGQELNRTGYWAPAMFDGVGNVRIPERVVVYYKGEGLANGEAEPFPEGAAMIASVNLNTVGVNEGGAAGKFSFVCSDNFSGASQPASNTIPGCDGSRFKNEYGVDDNPRVVLEMNVKFPQCWNGRDPANPVNYRHPSEGGWYYSLCQGEFAHTLVNLEYFINYRVELGENTSDWYLASDVDPVTRTRTGPGGATAHADWWSGWHAGTNQMFLDNCVNHRSATATGCGFGYLTDGGPDGANPAAGPALRYREQYTGPTKVPATELYGQLCPEGSAPTAAAAAYCRPGAATMSTTGPARPSAGAGA